MSLDILSEIDYPESDGQPMGETDLHRWWMIRIYELLKQRYRHEHVYIGSDLLLYYTEGIPRDFVVPDVFLVHDSDPGPRRTFKIWEEQRVPNVVFEVTSKATKKQDQVFKPQTYARIGVKELFLYDPTGDYLRPRLQGFCLTDGAMSPLPIDPKRGIESRELGLLLRLEKQQLALYDAQGGAVLLTEAEAERTARAEADRARTEADRERTESDRARMEADKARAAAEARAIAAEEELRQLRALLKRPDSNE